jgi:hypothetical protein
LFEFKILMKDGPDEFRISAESHAINPCGTSIAQAVCLKLQAYLVEAKLIFEFLRIDHCVGCPGAFCSRS